MRILVLSDSHGDGWAIRDALQQQPTAKAIIHLGDGAEEMAEKADSLTAFGIPVFQVRGNCDFGFRDIPCVRTEMLAGKRIFMTHGHLYDVKFDSSRIVYAAREQQADILLYGHTHVPVSTYEDGLYILNPGSLREGHYGIVDISPAGILTATMILR